MQPKIEVALDALDMQQARVQMLVTLLGLAALETRDLRLYAAQAYLTQCVNCLHKDLDVEIVRNDGSAQLLAALMRSLTRQAVAVEIRRKRAALDDNLVALLGREPADGRENLSTASRDASAQ